MARAACAVKCGAAGTPERIVHLAGGNGRTLQERFDVLRVAEGPTDVVLPGETQAAGLSLDVVAYCERDVLVCASHFPLPSFGRVVREGNGFRFEYAKAC